MTTTQSREYKRPVYRLSLSFKTRLLHKSAAAQQVAQLPFLSRKLGGGDYKMCVCIMICNISGTLWGLQIELLLSHWSRTRVSSLIGRCGQRCLDCGIQQGCQKKLFPLPTMHQVLCFYLPRLLQKKCSTAFISTSTSDL